MRLDNIFQGEEQHTVKGGVGWRAFQILIHEWIKDALSIFQDPACIGHVLTGGDVGIDHVVKMRLRYTDLVKMRQQ